MNPIVSPFFIYLLGVVDAICETAEAIAVIGLLASIVAIAGYLICRDSDEYEDYIPNWKRAVKITVPILVISSIIFIFTPTRKTLIGMVVAKHVTTNNIESLIDASKDVKDELKADIIEIIESISGEKKDSK